MAPKTKQPQNAAAKKRRGRGRTGISARPPSGRQARIILDNKEREKFPPMPKPVFEDYLLLDRQKEIHAEVMAEALRKCAELRKDNYSDFDKHSQSFHERDYTVNPYTRKGKGSIVKNNAASFKKSWATLGLKKHLQNLDGTRGQYGKPGAHIDIGWYDENMAGETLNKLPSKMAEYKWLLKNATFGKRLALKANITSDIVKYGDQQAEYRELIANLKNDEKAQRAAQRTSAAKSRKSKPKSTKAKPRKKKATNPVPVGASAVAVPSGTVPPALARANRTLAASAKRKRQTLAASADTDTTENPDNPLESVPIIGAVGKRPMRPAGNNQRRKKQKKK
jgi:hypothetical protein